MGVLFKSSCFSCSFQNKRYQNPSLSDRLILETQKGLWVLFIYLAALGLSCSNMNSQLQHVGSINSSLTRDRTWAPCIGSLELQPLDHQGGPRFQDFRLLQLTVIMVIFQSNVSFFFFSPMFLINIFSQRALCSKVSHKFHHLKEKTGAILVGVGRTSRLPTLRYIL